VIEFDIAAPRPTVWEPFTLPGLRPKWRGADEVREASESGRRGGKSPKVTLNALRFSVGFWINMKEIKDLRFRASVAIG
jgi:hypothetical protein